MDKKLYQEEELRRKSYYDLYEIAMGEKLIEAYISDPTREELIGIILKFRGYKTSHKIDVYNKMGFLNLQMLFDYKLQNKLHPENRIKIPHKIIIYNEFNLTREDNYKVVIPEYIDSGNVFLVNANNYVCGILSLEKDLETTNEYFLVSKQEFLNLGGLKNSKFSLIFFKENDAGFPYEFYNMKSQNEAGRYPFKLDYYSISIESFEYRIPKETMSTLCIDFGTANTTAGVYLDKHYVDELPTNDILNKNIKLNKINYVTFPDGEWDFSVIYPTMVYISDCRNPEKVKFLFGHDARRKLEENDYIVSGTLFYGLKRWVHEHEKEERVIDEFGNIRMIKRKDIIRAYLKYIIARAEYLFKCKFKRIHASSPVRLKEQFLRMFQEIFTYEEDQIEKREIIREINGAKDENQETRENLLNNEVTRKSGGVDDKAKDLLDEMSGIASGPNEGLKNQNEESPKDKAEKMVIKEQKYEKEVTYIDVVVGKNIIKEYEIITENSMDEAIAVLYNTIETNLQKNKYEENQEYRALIIDCGGGTTDLAACKFTLGNTQNVAYNLDIRTSFENGDENFGGNNITYRIMQYLKIIFANSYTDNRQIDINYLIPYDKDKIYEIIDKDGTEKVFEILEEEYQKAEQIIPTKFSKFENKMSDEYRQIKNNFYLLWEAAENLKKDFFKKDDTLRTKFDSRKNYEKRNDFHTTVLNTWNLYVLCDKRLVKETEYPKNIFTIRELEKLLKIDIYEMLRKFLNTYYEHKLFENYSLVKLSGQSTMIGVFQEVLKEFIPGRQVEFKTRSSEDEGYDLKLSCLRGAIKYLDYRKFGHMNVEIKNEIPLVPYSVWGKTYKDDDVEIIRTSNRANENLGFIDKVSSVMELKLYLKNTEEEIIREIVYKNDVDFIDKDAAPLIESLKQKISQNETDNVPNDITRFLVYTDENCWGFHICPIRRKDDQIWMGRIGYYPFENSLSEVNFFDGNH